MRGQSIPLSIPRRLVTDLMRFAIKVPTAPVYRRMQLGPVVAARAALATRPPWIAIFAKAYALVAHEMPELRRTYLSYPWPHLYEWPVSVAAIAVEREYQGEPAAFGCIVPDPRSLSLAEIGGKVAHAAQAPIEQIPEFRRAIRGGRLPLPLRRLLMWLCFNIGAQRAQYVGTYAVTTLAALGADSPLLRSVWTVALVYGPLDPDGSMNVGITTDHRVIDGAFAARALTRIEETLNGEIADELRASAPESRRRLTA
jgi:2-oxoacid dehydrogenases acyltransferase (catalytic domain)